MVRSDKTFAKEYRVRTVNIATKGPNHKLIVGAIGYLFNALYVISCNLFKPRVI